MLKTYSIYEPSTGVLLVDNLTFDQVAEQSKTYMDFFEIDDIIVVADDNKTCRRQHITNAQAFKNAWVDYFGELQAMGNLQ